MAKYRLDILCQIHLMMHWFVIDFTYCTESVRGSDPALMNTTRILLLGTWR